MTFRVKFSEHGGSFRARFGETHNISDDSYKRGYAEGEADGYDKGKTDGYGEGYEAGNAEGYTKGYGEGETVGYDSGCFDGVQSISSNTISGKITLTGTSIKAGTFWNATKITALDAPNATSIGDYAFRNCSALKEINAPNATSLGERSISICQDLTRAEFPKLTAIQGYTFYGDYALTYADFPKVGSIGASAFYRCALKTLILRKADAIVTLAATSAFTGSGIANGTGYIYVPDNLVEQYKTAANWATYASQIKPISDLEE